jgi:hypothetical protein
MVLFTMLHCDLGACQVDFDLYSSGLTTPRCVTAQAAVATQVIAGTHIVGYGLPKVSMVPQPR